MPYIIEKINLPKGFDRRVKLTDEEREEIRKLHKEGLKIREIARMFEGKCSRRLIQLVIYPERLEEHYRKQKEGKKWMTYYDKDKHREYVRGHRAYKALVFGVEKRSFKKKKDPKNG